MLESSGFEMCEEWKDSPPGSPELRLVLVGTIGCGKSLTADTLLKQKSLLPCSSRECQVRRGVAEGRRLTLIEAPRWYWCGGSIEGSVQRETARALNLGAPGPHAFLILVPVGQFTEVEQRVPQQLEEIFGRGVLQHSMVLLTCGDYLMGQSVEEYVSKDNQGLREVVERCGGYCHAINNRRPQDRDQVKTLLEKLESMAARNGGCYIPSTLQGEEVEHTRDKERAFWQKEEEIEEKAEMTLDNTAEPLRNGVEREGREDERTDETEEKDSGERDGWIDKANNIVTQQLRFNNPPSPWQHEEVKSQHTGDAKGEQSQQKIHEQQVETQHVIDKQQVEEPKTAYTEVDSQHAGPKQEAQLNHSGHKLEAEPIQSGYKNQMETKPNENKLQGERTDDKQQKNGSNFPLTTEGGILSQMSKLPEDKLNQNLINTMYHRLTPGENENASASSSSSCHSGDLRLVLLGRRGSGKSAAGNVILGREEFDTGGDGVTAVTQTCEKSRAVIGDKRVAVVDTPDWFQSEQSPGEVKAQISSCVALSAPGPHAFLLCVPVHQPAHLELKALAALEGVFGPGAVQQHAVVVFTHSDQLQKGSREGVEEYISSRRPEMLKLVEKCGDRYHVLERGSHRRRSVEELLEKVEQTVRESGGSHYTCPLYQEAESRVRQRQEELAKERKERKRERVQIQQEMADRSAPLQSLMEEEEEEEEEETAVQWEEMEQVREEAEKSVTLEDSVPSISTSSSSSSSSSFSSYLSHPLLHSVWEKVCLGAEKVPKLIAGGALLGGVAGAFFGGPWGAAIGATTGSVLTEVGRRRYSKMKTE